MEELRENPLFTTGYAQLRVIHVGLPHGYRDLE
jgi:hypothetical protein